ncbi:Dyp-type peroxidase domain-containing protein [Moraxella catarrhalis]|nr:Dyp-type peroxidase domain-containing protein [Moraxella catarrhalis]OAV04205.1 hypothetical protein AO381_0898 [Moraxella catarrhalis]
MAAIADGDDAGGSYVLLQKYRHDLNKWDKLPVCVRPRKFYWPLKS